MSRRRKRRGATTANENPIKLPSITANTTKIHTRLVLGDKSDDGAVLRAVAHPAMVAVTGRV